MSTRLFAALSAAVLSSSLTVAQATCLLRSDLESGLRGIYSEAPVAIGVTADGAVVELWTSKDGESWTIVVTIPSGPSCVIAAGETWQNIVPLRGSPL